MVAKIIGILSSFIVATISMMGYSGIVLLMAIESACIPLPSEIIMPFSGYLVSRGEKTPWRLKLRSASFNNIAMLPELLRGCLIADMVAILGSTFFVVGDIDK